MIHRERLYASCNWSALVLALVASILGAIALGTAWYRVEDSSRYTTTYYRWEGGMHSTYCTWKLAVLRVMSILWMQPFNR
jgi:hypothetical protein